MSDSTNVVYLIALAVLWVLLVWRDAQRAQDIAGFLARTREGLAAVSLVGTLLSGIGMTVLLVGGYLTLQAGQRYGLPPPARRTVAIGGVILILGWALRLLAWTLWKRRKGRSGEEQ